METDPPRTSLSDSGALWFVISVVGSVAGGSLAQHAASRQSFVPHSAPGDWAMLLAGLASILVAGFAAWKLARAGLYSWLLPLAAVNLVLLQPGRAGDARTWRLEWGVMGLALDARGRPGVRPPGLPFGRARAPAAPRGCLDRARDLPGDGDRVRALREPPAAAARAVDRRGHAHRLVGWLPGDGAPIQVARMKNRLRVLRAERDWSQADLAGEAPGLAPDRERDRERALRSEPAARLRDRAASSSCASRTSSSPTHRRRSTTLGSRMLASCSPGRVQGASAGAPRTAPSSSRNRS